MIAGHHAPPRDSASGIADYAWRLAEPLAEHLGRNCRLLPDAKTADVHVYHMGNNQLHWQIYRRALAQPGVVVLHDANLHHMHLGALTAEEYVSEFCHHYGSWHESLARQLWRDRARSAMDPAYFRFTMLKRLVEGAKAVIVHNEEARLRVRQVSAEKDVRVIPHFVVKQPAPDALMLTHLREELGLNQEDYVIGVMGHLRESKRLAGTLRAFARARSAVAGLRLLVTGKFVSASYERAVSCMLEQPGVIRRGYLKSDDDFWRHIHVVDACVNLRYPSCGESSGIAALMMGAGKPVVVTAGREWQDLPETAYLAVEPGPSEEEALTAYMVWLARNRRNSQEIGERARRHVEDGQSLESVAQRFAEVVKKYVV